VGIPTVACRACVQCSKLVALTRASYLCFSIALCCTMQAFYAAPKSLNLEHFLVYWVSSTAGAVFATLVWKAIEPRAQDLSEEQKVKVA
jgi:hypothetical protein